MNKKYATLLAITAFMSTPTWAAEQSSTPCQVQSYEMALRYQQQSAEIMAIQLQTYQFAQQRLATTLKTLSADQKPAIVIDLDETVLDNSKLLVRDMKKCHNYTQWDTWGDWEKEGQPSLIPGAKEFLEYANSQKVEIFYVSDRSQENKSATIKTLKAFALPQVSNSNVLLATESKELRRQSISKRFDTVMLLGDSLADFAADFKTKKPTTEQRQLVSKQSKKFGTEWIVMPNVSYGSWSHAKLDNWAQKK